MNRLSRCLAFAILILCDTQGAFGDSFETIDFWVGEGSQRAAMVIDWDEATDAGPSLSWGYRWNGVATGHQMLLDVLAADPRLFARMSTQGALGVSIYGIGYDFNGDGQFELTDGTQFNSDGIAITGPADFAMPVDPEDVYVEGWNSVGFWHYTNSPSESGAPSWATAPLGSVERQLVDGGWDGLVFTPYARPDGTPKTFPELLASMPEPAVSAPIATTPGDFNRDGQIDAADYTVWRDTTDAVVDVPGALADADFSGAIDSTDYAVWRDHYGTAGAAGLSIPEPAGWVSSLLLVIIQLVFRRD